MFQVVFEFSDLELCQLPQGDDACHVMKLVTSLASSAQANNFPFGIGSVYPSGYSVATASQYPILQSSTQQLTVTHVYSGHLSSVLPQQSVTYGMPAHGNGSQVDDLMGFDPISSSSFSVARLSSIGCHSHMFSSQREDRFILDS